MTNDLEVNNGETRIAVGRQKWSGVRKREVHRLRDSAPDHQTARKKIVKEYPARL